MTDNFTSLRQAIIDNTRGDMFWLGEILLGDLEKIQAPFREVTKEEVEYVLSIDKRQTYVSFAEALFSRYHLIRRSEMSAVPSQDRA